jgi:hypothetical protein
MLPKHLRNATPEEIAAFRTQCGRKATFTAEECRQHFRQRMIRENRLAEFDSQIAKYRDEGKSRRSATYAAMRDMGYRGAAHERKLFYRAEAQAMQDWRAKKHSGYVKAYRRRMKNKELDEVMDTLKPNATPEQEMDWVAAHRKLFHAASQLGDDDASPIKLTANDIKTAPSQAAVTLLTIALRDPEDWAKKKRDANKSKTAAGGNSEDDRSEFMDDLDEVERMLKAAERDA